VCNGIHPPAINGRSTKCEREEGGGEKGRKKEGEKKKKRERLGYPPFQLDRSTGFESSLLPVISSMSKKEGKRRRGKKGRRRKGRH